MGLIAAFLDDFAIRFHTTNFSYVAATSLFFKKAWGAIQSVVNTSMSDSKVLRSCLI